ncbi:hypothetical protein HALLA_09940 [Halostagnicola larsenii XH-48]|uniref:DUF7344 domain-containing protein n=1 Tax=Halostagnicola larsenii XH-48 TaxID=797299 RepID=W0JV04_9EURY|nr:hypothetical protein [Halostagnicola larsenii]AHG00863.1 hypothetical protein HALLA_09940 [Halostagnicola larsenii XH-48]
MSNDAVDPKVIDAVFDVLCKRDRRYALYFLLEHDRVSIQDLGNVVTGWVKADSSEIGHKDDRDTMVTAFRHRHVPLLIESSLVDYDEATESLSLSPCSDDARSLIERACAEETGA